MAVFKCPLNFACHVWVKSDLKDGCIFDDDSSEYIDSIRNEDCPIPVQIIVEKLVEVR
jgi:hypothetical protein